MKAQGVKGVYLAEINNPGVGFWSYMNWAVQICLHCELNDLVPRLHFKGYGCNNWFDKIFDYRHEVTEDLPSCCGKRGATSITSLGLGYLRNTFKALPLRNWLPLLNKYFEPNEAASANAGLVLNQLPNIHNAMGLHYRASDKTRAGLQGEANPIAHDKIFAAVDELLAARGVEVLLYSTDDASFLEAVQTRAFSVPTFALSVKVAPDARTPIHKRPGADLSDAMEALCLCATFASCNVVLKTPSMLSAWAKVLDPDIDVYLTHRPNVEYPPELHLPVYGEEK